ncbi:cell division protein SepF [Actinokineospora auranticolor]|uniref:Cell division protein SepF n=1 Tax=Actinokineospora auranticolor TaxID=155976 RepID=A0A2S6GQP1_9PSEU|nr:cell division protein SepF [Actinokineospora auranticolor]PPK67544.1 cell division inhibitor SepF [Actinokineospora auranticolor]
MSTLQKLKAYFGMVPADELDDYDAEEYDRRGYHRPEYAADDEFDEYQGGRRRWFGGQQRPGYRDEIEDDYEPAERPRPRQVWSPAAQADTGNHGAQTHGALAVDARRDPGPRTRAPEPQAPAAYPLGRVVTLHPRSYIEARTIGEHYRDGRPVIMNLTEMDDADAKRLVDFAAGLAFAMRGAMDKVTNKVFLISPPNVDPTAEDKRRLAEGGFASRS